MQGAFTATHVPGTVAAPDAGLRVYAVELTSGSPRCSCSGVRPIRIRRCVDRGLRVEP
ncbi:hypothetical protein ASESINO_289 [Erwinia phage vB_EamM_Asesino]|uniref:Uncharacterized protein n=1 Tax=Erwinia phage vB_EamM_Asesino TaxID=1883370 RepID=A0A1B2IAM7_9CAUD|nr:hypothetical protein ASESINO_289 [Erwinia phage vB_EamM_Asesino]ANZ48302.1 hypothetical protein ASESINO_289 [Erwinia phage vB_EamM_Asesino]